MKMFQQGIKVSSLRQLYDDMVAFSTSATGNADHLGSWEDFKKSMKGVGGLKNIPEEYKDYDIRITDDGKVVESFNGHDSITNLNH